MQNLHITRFIQFSLRKNILYVSGNYRLVFLEKQCQLTLCQPNSILFHLYLQPRHIIWLINDYFSLTDFFIRQNSSFHTLDFLFESSALWKL